MNVPESNVADVVADVVVVVDVVVDVVADVVVDVVADVIADVVVSSVEADNPTKQLRMAIIAILMARGNIMEDKLGKNQPVFPKLDIVDNNKNIMSYFYGLFYRCGTYYGMSLPHHPTPYHRSTTKRNNRKSFTPSGICSNNI